MSEEKTKTEYYKPQIPKEAPVKLNTRLADRVSTLPDVVQVRLKESAVASQIAVGLYKNPAAGFREIYANERRAAHVATKEFGAKPRIEVTLDPKTRVLVVQGIDSQGISSAVFADVLRWMGRTTNDDAGEVGQFGWGFFSAFALADHLKLETYARETVERYAVEATDARGFTLLPDAEASITEHGTKIQLKLKNQVKTESLLKAITDYCEYSDVPTYLTVTAPIYSSGRTEKEYDWETPAWEVGRTRLDTTIREKLDELVEKKEEPGSWTYRVEVNRKNYDFSGMLCGDEDDARTSKYLADILLIRIPIESDEKENFDLPLTGWVLNVKDERQHPPTPDRDRFKQGALTKVIAEINDQMRTKLAADMGIKTLDDYRKAKYKGVYALSGQYDQGLTQYFEDATNRLIRLLNVEIMRPTTEGEEVKTSDQWLPYRYRRVMAANRSRGRTREPLRKVVARSRNIFYYSRKPTVIPTHQMAVTQTILRTKYLDAEVITYGISDGDREHSPIKNIYDAMAEYGINMDAKGEAEKIRKALGKSWRKKAGLPELSEGRPPPSTWPVHLWTEWRCEPKRYPASRLPKDTIRINGKVERYIEMVRIVPKTKYGITKDHPALRGGTKLADFIKRIEQQTAKTERGQMTFSQLIAEKRPLTVYLTTRTEILEHYASPDALLVTAEGDTAVELMVYLAAKDKTFTMTGRPSNEKLLEAMNGLDGARFSYVETANNESATVIFLGLKTVKSPEVKELFLAAMKEGDDGIDQCLNDARGLDRDVRAAIKRPCIRKEVHND